MRIWILIIAAMVVLDIVAYKLFGLTGGTTSRGKYVGGGVVILVPTVVVCGLIYCGIRKLLGYDD